MRDVIRRFFTYIQVNETIFGPGAERTRDFKMAQTALCEKLAREKGEGAVTAYSIYEKELKEFERGQTG